MKIIPMVLTLLFIPVYGESGLADFFSKGMTETMTSYKGEWKFVDGKIIVIEHGSKFIKKEIKQEKNKPTEEEGLWGFKMLVKIPSENDLLDTLSNDAKPAFEKYEKIANEARRKTSSSSSSFFDLSNAENKMENVITHFLNVEYELLDKDGFFICKGYRSYSVAKAKNKMQDIVDLFRTKRDGVYEIYGQGRIPMPDIKRVESWRILITGYVED